ncbi:hypothetical protein MLD38_035558 [Melastoma candidum]|uniref:Uncharacterized protein n=1 Tax=Melastoma candidum TaxID=119954 RepID=A0ACB9LHH4_9MYRT|nr:hypothetical protein MLD38_035558 [Melastoma candidum]
MKSTELQSPTSSSVSRRRSWPWPYYCHHRPPTHSFRFHPLDTISPASSMADSSPPSPLTSLVDPDVQDVSLESVIRSAHSDRLFFNPGITGSSILDDGSSPRPRHLRHPTEQSLVDGSDDDVETATPSPYNDSVFLYVDSWDPLLDFHESMTEMVKAQDIKTWDGLVELLWWYLKVNDEANHSYIYGAFIDLSFSQAVFTVNSAELNSISSSREFSIQTLPDGGPPCVHHFSPTSPLSINISSSSEASSSLSMNRVSGLGIDDLDREHCSIISSDSNDTI